MQRKKNNHTTARGDWPLEQKDLGTSHLTRKFLFAIVAAVLLLACVGLTIHAPPAIKPVTQPQPKRFPQAQR